MARHAARAVAALAALALLWLVFSLASAGQPLVALGALLLGGSALFVYGTARAPAWKYLFPGVAGMLLFVAFPLLYTVQIGFTNYSSSNLLDEARARQYLLDQSTVDESQAWPFTLHAQPAPGAGGTVRVEASTPFRIRIAAPEGAPPGTPALLSPPIDPRTPPAAGGFAPLPMTAADGVALSPPMSLREVIERRALLMPLALRLPPGTLPPAADARAGSGAVAGADPAVLRYAGVREFGVVQPLWAPAGDGAIRHVASGQVYRPDRSSGFFVDERGERMQPGFKVSIGLANYSRMLLDADFRGPFVRIFVWTVTFAALTVLFAGGLGMALAVLLNWEAFRWRGIYRTLLFLPYAVPGFISILVFKGLFNQNFGEINALLDAVFGIRPAWFADPLLAKVMILIVNTWLGYPYFMVLCAGLIKAIPADLYEASAVAGAGPLTNFWRITAPLIVKPLTPLLISAFAFNFNNFVLISLLTDGRPDFLNTKLPAGTTDILVSYTYRIAFTDSGQNFGLAAAISTLIFAMVAVMGLVQLKLGQRADTARGTPAAGAPRAGGAG